MFRKSRWSGVLVLTGIMFAGIFSPAAAQESGKAPAMDIMGMMKGMMEHGTMLCMPCQRGECPSKYLDMADELGLSEAQTNKLRDINTAWKKFMVQNKAEMEVISVDIDSLLDMPDPDQSKLEAKIDEQARIKAGMMKECLKASLDTRKVLTPEQYKQARKIARRMPYPMMGEKEKAEKKEGLTPPAPSVPDHTNHH